MVTEEELSRPLMGWGITDIRVEIRHDRDHGSVASFTVVLKDQEWATQLEKYPELAGKRLNAIASRLRERLIRDNFPGVGAMKFVLESEA